MRLLKRLVKRLNWLTCADAAHPDAADVGPNTEAQAAGWHPGDREAHEGVRADDHANE